MSLQYVPDVIYDAGNIGYEELAKNLCWKLEKLNKGDILEIISTDPGVKESLLSWCKMEKHIFLDRKNFGDISYYYIEKR